MVKNSEIWKCMEYKPCPHLSLDFWSSFSFPGDHHCYKLLLFFQIYKTCLAFENILCSYTLLRLQQRQYMSYSHILFTFFGVICLHQYEEGSLTLFIGCIIFYWTVAFITLFNQTLSPTRWWHLDCFQYFTNINNVTLNYCEYICRIKKYFGEKTE